MFEYYAIIYFFNHSSDFFSLVFCMASFVDLLIMNVGFICKVIFFPSLFCSYYLFYYMCDFYFFKTGGKTRSH
jgi:hypothetical protein